MQIANYQIELPISLDFSYQLLYRGFDETKQSYYINIFPKSELDSIMYENISKKIQSYNYIQDAIEDDNNLLISYLNSNSWIKMPTKITNDQFNTYLKQLYDLYSLDILGFYDFNPDFLYINEKTVYTIDYGLRYSLYQSKYQQLYKNNYKQDQFMKTWMFGSLLYSLTTGIYDPSYLIKLNQKQINYHIEYNCRQNNISEDNIHFLKILLQVDQNIRPSFDQLINLFQLQKNQVIKIQSQISLNQQKTIQKIDNLNNNSNCQITKSKFTQSHSTFVPTLHHSKVKMAFKQNYLSVSQKDLKLSKINQYQYASQLIKSKLSLKHGQTIKNFTTTQSFYPKNQIQNNTAQNEQSQLYYDQSRMNQNNLQNNNLSINIDAINQNRSSSLNVKSQEQQQESNVQTHQMFIKQKPFNNLESKKKPKKNQINSFEQDFNYNEDDDEDDFII